MAVFRRAIASAIAELSGDSLSQSLPLVNRASKKAAEDFSVSVHHLPKLSSSVTKSSLALQWHSDLSSHLDSDLFEYVSCTDHQVMFKMRGSTLAEQILQKANPITPLGSGKKVAIEYSSPNIAKPFHAGHLRSTIIGGYLSRLHSAFGYDVTRINYLGDWGKQFGLLGVGYSRYGEPNELIADPIKHLFEVYVKTNRAADTDSTIHDQAREYFRALESGNKEEYQLWNKFRQLSVESYDETYGRLGIFFDWTSGESMYGKAALNVIQDLADRGMIVLESDGAELVDLSDDDLGKAIVRKNDGTTVYLSRDVAAAIDRMDKLGFDNMIYVAGSPQDLHFRQLFRILERYNIPWASECEHVNFGSIQGMSTRKGNVVFLNDILDEAQDRMMTLLSRNASKSSEIENEIETAEALGVSAVVVQDLKARRSLNYKFDWDRILKPEGDTGPFLQYTHARLCSIERIANVPVVSNCDLSTLNEPVALRILELLSMREEVLEISLKRREPSVLVQHLFQLCRECSRAHRSLRVKDSPPEIAQPRMLLFSVARTYIAEYLSLLGLIPLSRV